MTFDDLPARSRCERAPAERAPARSRLSNGGTFHVNLRALEELGWEGWRVVVVPGGGDGGKPNTKSP